MTVRRTPQAEAILELRLALADAGNALLAANPDVLPGAIADARAELRRVLDRAEKVGVQR